MKNQKQQIENAEHHRDVSVTKKVLFLSLCLALGFMLLMSIQARAQAPLTFSVEVTDAVCNGGMGTVTVTNVSGGVNPYSFDFYRPKPYGYDCNCDNGNQCADRDFSRGPWDCYDCRCRLTPNDGVVPSGDFTAGDVVCSVVDSAGNETLDTVTISEPPAITVSILPSGPITACTSAVLTAAANTENLSFQWIDPVFS